jgi:hypothetical protein
MLRRNRLLLILALPLFGAPAAAVDFGRPLTAEQVACEERQLERLQHRMDIWSVTGSLFLWRATAGGGVYRGLASTNDLSDEFGPRTREEEQLAFDLLLKAGEDFLDPRRPLLPQATLVRRDVDSNIHAAESAPPYITVTFDLAPEVSDPTDPRLPILITNRRGPGEGQDDRAGRGILLEDLLSPCHSEANEFDLRVFSILARTVRPSQCLLEPFPNCGAGLDRYRIVFFRDTNPLTYRMNVYSYLVACDDDGACHYGEGRVAFTFHVQVDDHGRLTGGEIKALPLCTDQSTLGGCTNLFNPNLALFVLPPLRPGIERQGEAEFLRAAHLNIEYDGSPYNVLEDTVNWADLLRDTAWNGGLVP